MPFTGQLGTPNSQFGNIVLGVSAGLGLDPFDFEAHVLTSSRVRILFTQKVTEDTALDLVNYVLTSLAAPGAAVVPAVGSIEFFDETRRSVVLVLSKPLTYSTDYSVQADGVRNDDGDTMVGIVRNFTANVQDPPRVLGAWQSKRGAVDVLFDRSVGPTSGSATFEIRDASSPGPGTPMAQIPWAPEGIPETTLRLTLPGGMPTASAFEIDFFDVVDESLNETSGTTVLTLALRSSPPYSLADLTQLQIIDASILGVDDDYLKVGMVRVYFNGPVLNATTTGNWAAFQSGPHLADPSEGIITAPDAILLPSLLILLSDFKAKFNAHVIQSGIHVKNDVANIITLEDPIDQATATPFINAVQLTLLDHFDALRVHSYPDDTNIFNPLTISPGQPNELAFSVSITNNLLKTNFNAHLADEYPITQFITIWGGTLNKIEAWANYDNIRHHETQGPHTLFVDLHLKFSTHKASIRLEATLTSEDGLSSTTPADFTGSFIARSSADPPTRLSTLVSTDRIVEVLFDRDMILKESDSIEVSDLDGRSASEAIHVTSTLPDMQRALKHIMNAYRWHISGSPGAGHQIKDTSNLVSPGDTPTLPTLESLITSANGFKVILINHMTNASGEWHWHPDPNVVRTADATDFDTVYTLVDDLIRSYLRHNAGSQHDGRAPHWNPGFRVFNVPHITVLKVEVPTMLDGVIHEVFGNIRGTYYENHIEGEIGVPAAPQPNRFLGGRRFHDLSLSVPFMGVSTRPSLSSAISKSGLILRDEGIRFESDTVEVFFSKPMRQVGLNSSNLTLSGGSTLQKESSWTDETRVAIQVVNMTAVPHSLTASGLTDEAGNSVY